MKPLGSNNQIHNYIGVFLISLACQFLAFLWTLTVINETKEKLDGEDDHSSESERKRNSTEYGTMNENEVSDVTWYKSIRHIFDYKNVIQMFKTTFKRRDENKRMQIIFLLASDIIILICFMGSLNVLFQFTQRNLNWDSKMFTFWDSFGSIFSTTVMILMVPLLVKIFHVTDPVLIIIGAISMFLQNFIRGTFKSSAMFISSYIFGSLYGISALAIRSRLSKIVDKHETGQIFSILSAFESMVPLIASTFFALIFKATISMHPGLIFQMAALILFVPLITGVWIDLYCQSII